MRILFLHRWVGVHHGGAERHVREIAGFLREKGHDVAILTRQGPLVEELRQSFKVYTVSRNPAESDFSYEDWRVYLHTFLYMCKVFVKLMFLRLRRRFDIVSVHFATESIIAQAYRAITSTPFLFVIEGYTGLEARLAKNANLSVAISKHEVDECIKNYGYRPVLNNIGINVDDFIKRGAQAGLIKRNPDTKIILTVCRLEPRKDLFTLLDAARIIKDGGGKNLRFVIVGDGISENALRARCRDLGLDDIVTFVGRVCQEDLPRYYFSADIFVLPTLYEGFGIVYLEAMAAGLPIISTRVGAVAEIVGDSGVLIEPKNPALLADKIRDIASDDVFCKELARRGRMRARGFDSEVLLKALEVDIERLLRRYK